MTEETLAQRALRRGVAYPYAEGFQPCDWADNAALGVCADLCDRGGIKHQMEGVDDDVRLDIVRALAAIIRASLDDGLPFNAHQPRDPG